MKPRIFVSSTYYDLKHIRNNIERFIEQYGFEPVLFESGNVTFDHEQKLDESGYNEVKLCHIMILIIGGRYGGKASESDIDPNSSKYIKSYEENYISITRKEFQTAQELGIPIFIFVEKNVHAEYYTFSKNKEFFNELHKKPKNERIFEFAHVDSIKIFDFIEEVQLKAVQTFEKFSDIENYLRNQWAGMFFLYLNDQLRKNNDNKILDAVSEIRSVSERMNEMLTGVGKKVLTDNGEYEEIIKQQNLTILKFFIERFAENIDVELEPYQTQKAEEASSRIASLLIDSILNNKQINGHHSYKDFKIACNNAIKNIKKYIDDYYEGTVKLNFLSQDVFHTSNIRDYQKEIEPLITKSNLQDTFKKMLAEKIDLSILPF